MKMAIAWIIAIVVVLVALPAAVVTIYVLNNKATTLTYVANVVNSWRFRNAPAGTLTTEENPSMASLTAMPLAGSAGEDQPAAAVTKDDWPSYNKSLTSDRFSPLSQINTANAGRLHVICTYDTHVKVGFNAGLLEVNGALIGTTYQDIFSIDPATCRQNWRTHEDYKPASPQWVNRGAAYLDGRLFKGTLDGRVLAYDFQTGKRLWATEIADPKKGETVPAAPIAWNGMVFVGTAGGDIKDNRGRMYGLDAATGKIVWEFYLVPRQPGDPQRGPEGASPLDGSTWQRPGGSPITGGGTWTSATLDPATGLLYVPGGNPAPDFGADVRRGDNRYSGSVVVLDAKTGDFRAAFPVVPRDWHDYDVSSAPALIKTASGKQLLIDAPKDGHLYGFDLASHALVYRVPVTTIQNPDVTFAPGKSVHFCPGTTGGAEWNGPGFDPATNLVYIGEVDWCATVEEQSQQGMLGSPKAKPWSGEAKWFALDTWGKFDPPFDWGGWLYAVNADTGQWRWRIRTNYPIQSGMTPTAGGVVFFGDMGGDFYAVDAVDGHKLWGQKIGGAIGGGVIAYTVGGQERVAVATGLTELIWPTEITTAKVSILGV